MKLPYINKVQHTYCWLYFYETKLDIMRYVANTVDITNELLKNIVKLFIFRHKRRKDLTDLHNDENMNANSQPREMCEAARSNHDDGKIRNITILYTMGRPVLQ